MNEFSKLGINLPEARDDNYQRMSWDEYFMSLAHLVAKRSHDSQTQHGAVLVAPDKRIIATGYNGYPAGGPDEILPNIRPYKYPYMIHAEMNAIISAKRDLKDCTFYVTGPPCNPCMLHVSGTGIKEIVIGGIVAVMLDDEWELLHKSFVQLWSITVRRFKGTIILTETNYESSKTNSADS